MQQKMADRYINLDHAIGVLKHVNDITDVNIDVRDYIDALIHLPYIPLIRCHQCKYYEGVHNVQGCAPCSFWNLGGVMWKDFCSRGEKYEQ